MSTRIPARSSSHLDGSGFGEVWEILPIADTLVELRSSTTARIGLPVTRNDLDYSLFGGGSITSGAFHHNYPLWHIDVTSTDTGITYESTPRPVREEVRKLRDEIARRSRLTREQIARAVGVDRRSLSAWVKGESTPSTDKLKRLQLLADVARDIDLSKPETVTEILLSRSEGRDLLDHISGGRLTHARNWPTLVGVTPSVKVVHRRTAKRPLHQNALDAYLRGELRPLGRAATIRPESDYEQDLDRAEYLMPDEPVRRSRRGYR
ncbi:helix-turn-helix transcriptional regulator [Ferrimicrobium sp.]|uniref:helix-turn-helix domain-containing protein n=1 Tax=Ferrimicrobium sp. TaxID=2926050 RepID=UPI002632D428|nr:helix-turn-helix transcriptional regulator [Ferrimicrobium sp.]